MTGRERVQHPGFRSTFTSTHDCVKCGQAPEGTWCPEGGLHAVLVSPQPLTDLSEFQTEEAA